MNEHEHTASRPDEEAADLWYGLGRLYARAGGRGWPATRVGVTAVCVTGALVLLSAPVFGTGWVGSAPGPLVALPVLLPVTAGLLAGGLPLLYNRVRTLVRQRSLRRALEAEGEDPRRPTLDGLGLYYDEQLILLRSEYEALRHTPGDRARRKGLMMELAFGFAPEDPFECGPLNVLPGSSRALALRGLWESRLRLQLEDGEGPPALGLGDDLAYRIFPREMTTAAELATRAAYLEISRDLMFRRHGAEPLRRLEKNGGRGEVYRRAERDLTEYERIADSTRFTGFARATRRPPRRRRP
ncbi:hypothetical protein [Rubrobacter aplysinae]|uniref:hypothetical protein n=1 Tax=Rubrobacter aplysinae TaxID=909625 RepID=UPI00064BE07C|nr:hypothetical protein [Rubrobacter aplysinae]